ncbi:MAG: phosphate ABC transporter permease subunit PstC [Planctomycetota bacterium]
MKDTRKRNLGDPLFRWLVLACALAIVAVVAAIFWQLAVNSRESIRRFGASFLWSAAWNPVREDYGAASSIFGTLASTLIAMALAVPLSLGIAIFLVELAHPLLGRPVGVAIELLAAVPSIIFGMWGLFVFSDFMRQHVQPCLGRTLGFLPLFQGPPMGIGMLTAGIILAVMILPYMSAVSRDVLSMVPPVVKESAHGLGATTWEVTRQVSLPYAIQGLLGACFLGLGRAIGETMAVTFVIGNSHRVSASLFEAGNSIASTLANEFGESIAEPLSRSVLIELGLILFCITLFFQILAQLWLRSLRGKLGRTK